MKKLYQNPELEVCMILEQDILTISGFAASGVANEVSFEDLKNSQA